MNILAVDDDSDHLALLQTLLRGWGHNVKTAACGEDALELLASFWGGLAYGQKLGRGIAFRLLQKKL